MSTSKPDLKAVPDTDPGFDNAAAMTTSTNTEPEVEGIAKPGKFDLDKFKSKRSPTVAGVETLLTALPHCRISDANDFVQLHPDIEKYWSPELCFVNVPIKGQKRDTLHLIDEELALRFLSGKKILRQRLVLATKPYDVFFLCEVPTQNTDNPWNSSNLQACDQARTHWVWVTSRKAENVEAYKIDFAQDQEAFPKPKWPMQSLDEIITVTFTGRMIVQDDHPGLLRLIGAKQFVS
jgi:hypothetical protein